MVELLRLIAPLVMLEAVWLAFGATTCRAETVLTPLATSIAFSTSPTVAVDGFATAVPR